MNYRKPKQFMTGAFLLLAMCAVFVCDAFSCTTFCLKSKGEMLFGRNYDWAIGDGLVMVNKRGVQKVSMAAGDGNPAKWISKYGSVTFNQYGRENPMGGMNEAGLVIEIMWLDETQYPKADSRPAIDVLEWIQRNLDTAATVAEVLKNAENVRIKSDVKIHYLVNDKNGNSATVEFLNGQMVTHSGNNLAYSALANDTYDKSINYLNATAPEKAKTSSSLDRFTRAAEKSKEFAAKPKTEQQAVDYAFDVLSDVAQKGYTQWSVVYDQKRGKIYFRTLQSPTIKSLDAKAFDYSCATAVKIFDINSKDSGNVTAKFTDYTRAANRDLLGRSFAGTSFLKDVPAMVIDGLAAYPENFACSSASGEKAELKTRNETVFLPSFVPAILNFLLRS
ncbi:MAG: linear amide C-N hydrolase [Pyrinomonadaceae bacterium]